MDSRSAPRWINSLILAGFASLVNGALSTGCAPLDDGSGGSSPSSKERLFLGTGEYSAATDWHGLLRFEDISGVSGTDTLTPDETLNTKALTDVTSGYHLNFGHGIFHRDSRDELYMAMIFTRQSSTGHQCAESPTGLGPGGTNSRCGSIAMFSSASSIDSASTQARHLVGASTLIKQPHGVWVDTVLDQLYVTSTFSGYSDTGSGMTFVSGGDILVFNDASTVDGDVAPNRRIPMPGYCAPIYAFVEPNEDLLFVACAPMQPGVGDTASVLIYRDASTLNVGPPPPAPLYRITGDTTRITLGNNKTGHNVWYDHAKKLMFFGHHTNEILIFDLSSVNLTIAAGSTADLTSLVPRVVYINEDTSGADQYSWSLYGLFYLASQDRLYVSAGYTGSGSPSSTQSGNPGTPGDSRNAVKVWNNISDTSIKEYSAPDRLIQYSNSSTFYPPQPLWVVEH